MALPARELSSARGGPLPREGLEAHPGDRGPLPPGDPLPGVSWSPPSCSMPVLPAPWGGWGGIWELFPRTLLIQIPPALGSSFLAPKAPGGNVFGHVRGVLAFLPSASPRWGWPLAMGLAVSLRSPRRLWARCGGAVGRGWHPAGSPGGSAGRGWAAAGVGQPQAVTLCPGSLLLAPMNGCRSAGRAGRRAAAPLCLYGSGSQGAGMRRGRVGAHVGDPSGCGTGGGGSHPGGPTLLSVLGYLRFIPSAAPSSEEGVWFFFYFFFCFCGCLPWE